MADSDKGSADYAPGTQAVTAAQSATVTTRRRFQPRLWPTLAAALLVPLFMAAGQWQWNKANSKKALQQQLDAGGAASALQMPTARVDAAALRYRKILAQGQYEPKHQILIDNRIQQGRAGYEVITPLRLEGSEMRVLVNRGWIPALPDRRQTPQISTPAGRIEISGTGIIPGTRFFTLGTDATGAASQWQSVWQNLDMARFGKAVSFPVQPIIIQLDPDSTAGGFVREWQRPDERLQTNLNYAIQWWTFAATTVVLWLVVNFRKPS
ncbi:SURF1 family protein [Uliginosibacterium flavum]|uniref:SURF1-like protein n=1 Tax=Uliginosibacterium flavum TaxID=1396831 RepID=A0ABV2TLV1_9RHOO